MPSAGRHRILIRLQHVARSWSWWRDAGEVTANIFAGIVVALGVVATATSIWLVVHAYSPVLFWDQWELIRTLMDSHGHPAFRDFWAQHNEHRIVTGRLFGFADLYLFGGRNVSLFAEIIAFQCCHLALLLFAIRRFGSLPRRVYVTLSGFLLYCLFSPIQMENFVWAFQTVFVLCSLLASACCVGALCHARRAARPEHSGGFAFLALAAGCAFVAEITEANGLVAWVVLLFLAFALRFSRREKIVLFVVAALAIAVYFVGYKSPSPPGAIAQALRHPGQVFHFIVTYLGRSWDPQLPNASAWPSVSESLTAIAIVGTIVSSVWCLWKPRAFSPLQIALLGEMLFVLGTAASTALGRMQFGGLQGATAIRYQTPALIFWVSLAAVIALQVRLEPDRSGCLWRKRC